MLTAFLYQVLRLLRSRVLLVWTLGFPVVPSLISMVQFSSLDKAFEATPMSSDVVQDEAYRVTPGLDAVVKCISADDADHHFITKVTHLTVTQAEAAAKRGEANDCLAVEDSDPVLHMVQQGDEAETTRALRVVMDSYTQRRAKYVVLTKVGAASEKLVALGTDQTFTHSISVTSSPVKPQTHYYSALLAFACGMGTIVALVAVKGIMAVSPVGARQTLAGLPHWKALTVTFAASWVCMFVCLLVALAFMASVVGVDFEPHVLLCLVTVGVCSLAAIGVYNLMASAVGAALGALARLEIEMTLGLTALLSLFTDLCGPAPQSLASSIEQCASLLVQANPLQQTARCFYGLLYYDSLAPFARSCAILLGMTYLFLTIALIRARRMTHGYLQDMCESCGRPPAAHPHLPDGAEPV